MYNCKYFVMFRGDDTDFAGNQRFVVELQTELDLTGMTAHFRLLGFQQDFDEIPNDKKLEIVIPASSTSKFPLGSADAEVWLIDSEDRRRTVANRIHFIVTNSIREAYDNDDPQAITVVISGGGGTVDSISWNNITNKPQDLMMHREFSGLPSEDMIPSEVGLPEICNMLNQIKNLLRPATAMLMALLLPYALVGASVSTNQLMNLKGASNVVTAVSLDGLATTNDVDFSQANTQLVNTIHDVAPTPGNYSAVSNAAMNALSRAEAAAGFTPWVFSDGVDRGQPVWDENFQYWYLNYEGITYSEQSGTIGDDATIISSWMYFDSGEEVSVPWTTTRTRLPTMADIAAVKQFATNYTDSATNALVDALTSGAITVTQANDARHALSLEGTYDARFADAIFSQLDASTETNATQTAQIAANASAATNYTDAAIAGADTSYRRFTALTNLNQSVQFVTLSASDTTLSIEPPTNGDTKDWIVYVLAATNTTLVLPPATWYMTDTANTNDIPAGMTAFYFTQMTDGLYMLGRQELKPITIVR